MTRLSTYTPKHLNNNTLISTAPLKQTRIRSHARIYTENTFTRSHKHTHTDNHILTCQGAHANPPHQWTHKGKTHTYSYRDTPTHSHTHTLKHPHAHTPPYAAKNTYILPDTIKLKNLSMSQHAPTYPQIAIPTCAHPYTPTQQHPNAHTTKALIHPHTSTPHPLLHTHPPTFPHPQAQTCKDSSNNT